MTLTEFLLARFDDDERAARKLAEVDRRPVLSLAMTVNHPERLLLEIEAKRELVSLRHPEAMLVAEIAESSGDRWEMFSGDHYSITRAEFLAQRNVLRVLGSVYADHPDFDESWRS